jgi:hypothetical protein
MAASKSSSASVRTKTSTGSEQSATAATSSIASRPSSADTEEADRSGGTDGLTSLVEQFTNTVIKPLDLVMLSRERIQDALDEAAEHGRLTRSAAHRSSPRPSERC